MNLREGTRRLALLLGVAGAILGGFASYMELQTVQSQRTRHERFEQLANSSVVKEQRETLQSPNPYASIAIPIPQHGRAKLSDAQPISPPQHGHAKLSDAQPVAQPNDWQTVQPNDGQTVTAAPKYTIENADGTPLDTEVNKGGISTIHWAKDYGVAFIETQDGQTLYPTSAPGAGSYLLIAILPLLGFFIPWVAVRAIGWVLAGFVQQSH